MNIFKFFALSVFALSIFAGCAKESCDYGDGSASFKLDADYTVASNTTRAEGQPELNIDEFTLEIFNSSGVRFKRWKYGEIKEQNVRMNAGNFKAKAWYGDSTATGFDAIHFAGSSDFEVKGQSTTPVSLLCRMANVKVAVEWGENIRNDYADYSVKIFREGKKGELLFTKEENRCGYIPAGDIKMEVTLVGLDGKSRVYRPEAVACAGNDFITFEIDTKKIPEEELTITFKIENGTEVKEETVVIPSIFVAKEAPSFEPKGFVENAVGFVEGSGVEGDLYVGITAPAFISSCRLISDSDFLPSSWPAEVDIMSGSEEVLSTLRSYGLDWNLSKESRYGMVDFKAFARKLQVAGDNLHNFKLIVTDTKGKSSEISLDFNITPVELTASPIEDVDMWATRAYITVTTNGWNSDAFRIDAMSGSDVAATFAPVPVSREGNVTIFEVSGLNPSTKYSFRVNYNNGLKYSELLSGTTEAAQQLSNGSLEGWSQTQVWKATASAGTNSAVIYRAEVPGWSTRNDLTTKGAKTEASWWNNYGLWYKWCSNSIETGDSRSGAAAEISTMGFWTAKTGSFYTCSSDAVLGKVQSAGVAYVGYLFLGTYDSASDKCTLGVSHTSRPESVSFWYKYVPCKSGADKCTAYAVVYDAGRNEIARTETFQSAGANTYTQQVLKLNYTNKKAKAAYITVFFKSGDDTDRMKMHLVPGGGSTTTAMYDKVVGSVLTVDDVALNY